MKKEEVFETHNFDEKLKQEQADTVRVEMGKILRNLFPEAERYMRNRRPASQRAGIDVLVRMPWNLPDVTIDFKIRESSWSDFALEFRHEHDDGHTWPGWIEETNKTCDYFGYVFKETWECYLLPRVALQHAWKQHRTAWLQRGPIIRARNKDYWSICCCVPIDEVHDKVHGVRAGNEHCAHY